MARIWAIASGNWSANVTWSSNAVPTIQDEVYLNGYDVTLNSNPVCAVITNELCPDTNQQGGHLVINTAGTRTINADLRGVNSDHLILDSTNRSAVTLNVVGDVVTSNCNFIYYSVSTTGNWGRKEINITGDVSNDSIFATAIYQAFIHQFQITGGNVVLNKIFVASANANAQVTVLDVINGNLTINTDNSNVPTIRVTGNCILNGSLTSVTDIRVDGNLTLYSNVSATTVTINGNITAMNNYIVAATTLNIGGNIEYQSNNNTIGVQYTTLNILNPDTFIWHDISTPRTNPFMIITDADTRNLLQYPAEDRVVLGTPYAFGEKIGSFDVDYPPESVVLNGYEYDNGNMTGNMSASAQVGCVTKEDVREGVALIGMYEDEQQVVGTLVVPSVDDVREGVIFDNGSVGTLIVQGGGDRLRIADFGYYTRSTSITYIVDLTESDKPAFADCERIVLLSLFPTLDLDNIPDKFFDDLFVQFLRYRLLVEYYRGISINSKFTPSEPTTEIVNYANTKCEYWLNTANLFLQLWGEKYPNSVKKDRILL